MGAGDTLVDAVDETHGPGQEAGPCIHLLIRFSSCGHPGKYVWTANHILSAFSPFSRVAESLGNSLHQHVFFTLCLCFTFQMALGSGLEGRGEKKRWLKVTSVFLTEQS